jgi:outer membrane protein OmpA-like peptidoglycan-associated protein
MIFLTKKTSMKFRILTLLTLLISFKQTNAQRYYGIANSNYAATNGLYINPANVADNRMLMDLQFASANVNANQNYGYAKNYRAFIDSIVEGNGVNFTRSSKINNVGFNILGEVRGPSFMMQLGNKHKAGIGLLTRLRGVGSGNGINTDYFTFINDGIKGVKLANGSMFSSGNLNINLNVFTEIGIIYGQELLNKNHNFIKAGLTVKHYNGLGFASSRANNFSVTFIDTSISRVRYNGTINASKSFSNDNFEIDTKKILFGGPGSGFGFDIGAVYEYRDGVEDEETGNIKISDSRAENKYKFKVGFAIQDIGSMKYKSSPKIENYLVSANNITVSRADTANLSYEDITTYFRSIGGTFTKDNNAVKIKAPTVFTVYGDYGISKRFYVNALFTGGLVGNNANGTRTAFQTVVTPRFESKFFDAGLPISYNGLSEDVKVGLGLRLGIFYIGSDDVIGSVTGLSKIRSANAYAGLHAAIPYRKKKVKELPEDVPTKPTPVEVVPEKPKDTDGDGVQDNDDKCPTVFGLAAFNGCPDTDADGVQDSEDKCPTTFGLKAFAGCPDTDADGLQDSEDDCPTQKGPIALKGCPDSDGDGVSDKNDKCVDKPGPISNEGCPVIATQVIKKLNYAAQAIQFQTGKDILKPTSFKQLNEVVKILNEYTDYNINIEGHTDNVGNIAKNKTLSEKRAAAVKKYFISKGISAERLIDAGFGDTKPLVPNTTAANKAKNRRVEMTLKLKD